MKSRIIILMATVGLLACNRNEEIIEDSQLVEAMDPRTDLQSLNLPEEPFNYVDIDLPSHFFDTDVVMADNTPNTNPLTNEGATLGRVLFYDNALSLNNTKSCASCHTQESGFTDNNAFSTGFEGGLTGRNSMSLANSRYYEPQHFFWDERAATLEDQVLLPIQDAVEMGMTLDSLVGRLSSISYYPTLFAEAFGDSAITEERISLALAQFVRSMVSYQSPYDVALEANGGDNEGDLPGLSVLENLGKNIFFGRGGCDNCHETALFIAEEAFNNGLDANIGIDDGVGAVTGRVNELGLFKVPSLRNVEVGGPFMHDGRFATLEEVVEHYNNGVQDHPNLSREMRGRGGDIRRLNLEQEEIEALVAFMESFTDEAFLTDEKFSSPFSESGL